MQMSRSSSQVNRRRMKLLAWVLASGSAIGGDTLVQSKEPTRAELMEQGLVTALKSTHYAALIENTLAQGTPLPDDDASDDHRLVRWSFKATVLETFRGPPMSELRYSFDLPEGEETGFRNGPFLIFLCMQEDRYHWPGIGFAFAATPAAIRVARETAQRTHSGQPPESIAAECTELSVPAVPTRSDP